MGEYEVRSLPRELVLLNGLLGDEVANAARVLDEERWLKAEERTAELLACIQPNPPSLERRNAVADYVQRLIMKCFSCEVFTYGSVPLKTYLPDGDIDLTAFSKNEDLKDTWANEVREVLEKEEKSENTEFCVKEVQYIQAEVKIIKCLVENIVVDISFNQVGGLCTLCFLEEIDQLISQNHLFKRSIILIKSWCYYESRILGAHHGLISTYALEILVLYIFHVFNNSFTGPLEVLYRFLEFFSQFNWDKFCVSLWGPIPISSLPDMTAESPRKDGGELLLSGFLEAFSMVYTVFPSGQESQGQQFVSKHFNIIDPLNTNNNLGRSVSKGNFYRIRSAFAFGAKRLARLLDCPKEDLTAEVDQFFMNTWQRHGSANRPDAPAPAIRYLQHVKDGPAEESSHSRTQSSTSLAETPTDEYSQTRRGRVVEAGRSRRRHTNVDVSNSQTARVSFEVGSNSNSVSKSYQDDTSFTVGDKEVASVSKERELQQLEQQDLVNRIASSQAHNFIGHVQLPMHFASHPPLPPPPPVIASMGYAQRNLVTLINPSLGSTMQFPRDFISSQPPQYISNVNNLKSNFEGLTVNGSSCMTLLNHENRDVGSTRGLVTDSGELQSVHIPMAQVRDVPKHAKSNGNKWGRKPYSSNGNSMLGKAWSEWEFEAASEDASSQEDDESGDWIYTTTSTTNMSEHAISYASMASSHSHSQLPGYYERAHRRGVNSMIPLPVLLGGSQQKLVNGSGVLPFSFYPSGPPFPFFTMVPSYNFPAGWASFDGWINQVENDNGLRQFHASPFGENFGPAEIYDQFDHPMSLSISEGATPCSSEEDKPDILDSDFASHWQNLQYGRFCQIPHTPGPFIYPSPFLVPPAYLQGHFPMDGHGRPYSASVNFTPITGYSPRLVPVASLQPRSSRPYGVYNRYGDELPRYQGGTGTYLPNPASFRERQFSNRRNWRGYSSSGV